MHTFKSSLKVGIAAMALAFAFVACGGDDKQPQNPEPPPPAGCCQIEDRCVEDVADALSCEQRGGEYTPSGVCSANQCVRQ